MDGGYDSGYKSCPCFWGTERGSLIKRLEEEIGDVAGLSILDVGCGEGMNSAHLAIRGARVRAIDISAYAIANAKKTWGQIPGVQWEIADVRRVDFPANEYDVVIIYGLLHCLSSIEEVHVMVLKLQKATKSAGYNVVCAFNNRFQDLSAHPEFEPCLLDHGYYVMLYKDWELITCSDSDLTEVHPHNKIPHTHSMTRIIARKSL